MKHVIGLLILSIIHWAAIAGEAPDPLQMLDNDDCIACHQKDQPQLISDWKISAHAHAQPEVDCVACHASQHQRAAIHARRDNVCIDCHGGNKAAVVHSYSTSKHGVIMTLEQDSYDWQQPLADANYRSPGCSYCHFHRGQHNLYSRSGNSLMEESGSDNRLRQMCQDCHAPRYVSSLFSNNEKMLEIARKKIREADMLIARSARQFSEEELLPVKKLRTVMRSHLENVHLGGAHQSPDYQPIKISQKMR